MDAPLSLQITSDDIRYLLFDNDEVISEEIRSNGNWNVEALKICDKILRNSPYGTVIDIGAGIGAFSIPLCIFNQNKFNFICFEPIKILYYQLCANILMNKIDVIDAHRKIISSEHGKRKYKTINIETNKNHGSFSFIEAYNDVRGINSEEEEMFEITTLDKYHLSDVRLIKISVSGMESSVIDGAIDTIRFCHLPPIALQCWDNEWFSEERKNIIEKIIALGYNSHFEGHEYIFFFKNERESEQLQRDTVVAENLHQYKIVEQRMAVENVLQNQPEISLRILNSV